MIIITTITKNNNDSFPVRKLGVHLHPLKLDKSYCQGPLSLLSPMLGTSLRQSTEPQLQHTLACEDAVDVEPAAPLCVGGGELHHPLAAGPAEEVPKLALQSTNLSANRPLFDLVMTL
jgi:hypothetical protein